jgi:hypothetical protein
MPLGYQVLQPNISGGANPSNSHFTNQYSSIVGGVSGCGGAGGSAAALAGKAGYNIIQRGGRRSGGKRSAHKRSGGKRSAHKRSSGKRSRRNMRGGLSALSPASFSGGANLPYHQFMGGQPLSLNYGIGSRTPLVNSGLANPPARMGIVNNCQKL